jgi:hypothetical protein
MINETICVTASMTKYEVAREFYSHPSHFVPLILAWLLPFLLLIIVAICLEGKTASGKSTGKSMIQSPNFIVVVIFFLLTLIGILLSIFPVWLMVIA